MFLIDVINEQFIPIVIATAAVLLVCVLIWRSV